MSIKSKQSCNKNEKAGKKGKRKKTEDSEDMESSEEELDLTKECHPIGYYVNDRAEMINQMFSVIKGNKLKAMLPPILRDCDIDLLKLQCLDQLLGMSEKRISCILDGETLETSSESDVESNACDTDRKNNTSSCSTSDGTDESVDEVSINETEKKKGGKRKGNLTSDGGKPAKMANREGEPPAGAEQGKTLLEILELEMRARAIRALLKQNETVQDGTEVKVSKENGLKDEVNEVVDLTGCEDEDFPVLVKKEKAEELLIDEKVMTFEEKIEKSHVEKGSVGSEVEKAKRMQAELELRNKLFKKKIYRTRQQRMENEEEDKDSEKQKPVESEECQPDDPEEGEVSSSEDESRETVKKPVDLEPEKKKNLEDGCNKPDSKVSDRQILADEPARVAETDEECLNLESEEDVLNVECSVNSEESGPVEETSWRDRWLRKDGVQKLVKSSKIYAKVKKRIAEKSHRSKEESNPVEDVKPEAAKTPNMEVIEGSIEEYEKLIGKQVKSIVEREEDSSTGNMTKTTHESPEYKNQSTSNS